jgi:5-methylcytosine-specific restriction endonuclease McrA
MEVYQKRPGQTWRRKKNKARKKAAKAAKALAKRVSIPEFYNTEAWKRLRYHALVRDGGRCLCCGRAASDGVTLNVDHIKPRKKYPHLALDLDNLQTLCASCNWGKGASDQTDWRKQRPVKVRHDPEAQMDMDHIAELREHGLLN